MEIDRRYLMLFNAITDALEAMAAHNYGIAEDILKKAQIAGEESFLSETEEEPH